MAFLGKFAKLVAAGMLCLAATLASATTYEAVGIAPIDAGGIEKARIAAIRDATRQAAIQAGAEFELGESVSKDGLPLQSSRLRAPREFASVTVIREWREGDMLHVLVRADDSSLREQDGVPRQYRKKVLAAQFTLLRPAQSNDVDDLWNGLPRELVRRLEASTQILPRTLQRPLLVDAAQAHAETTRTAMRQAATESDAQFIISGLVLDMGNSLEGGYYGFFKKNVRRFEVEVFIHDGLTGALVGHHRLSTSAKTEEQVEKGKPFGTSAFFTTPYGKAIDQALDELAVRIVGDLARLPFAARIVRVEGKRIFIDAGTTSAIGSGDTMVVYKRRDDWMLDGVNGAPNAGMPETPVTTVSITQVQPLFASGELQGDADALKVRVGDLVRFEARRAR